MKIFSTINLFLSLLMSLCSCVYSTSAAESAADKINKQEFEKILKAPSLEFQEYSNEYFEYATTPQNIIKDVLTPQKIRILEIGSAQGYFIEEIFLNASEVNKKIGLAAVEFVDENRQKLTELFIEYKQEPYAHSGILAKAPDLIDYIRHNPQDKKAFFTSIISFYSVHCICPLDLLAVLPACYDFLQPGGTMQLTLQAAESLSLQDASEEAKRAFEENVKNGDLFPGYNFNESFTRERLETFIKEKQIYPRRAQNSKSSYTDSYLLAHDTASLLPTLHEEKWTRTLLEICGFEVERCSVISDTYPACPLKEGEISSASLQTQYLFVKARKGKNVLNKDIFARYQQTARLKQDHVFAIYQEIVKKTST